MGLGSYSTHQLGPALKLTQHCRLAGVVTGSVEKGVKWAREYGFPDTSIYGYDTMAKLADNPAIDVVYVVTPNGLHAQHTIAAAKAGKHVICEKPMARSLAECDAMIAACKDGRRATLLMMRLPAALRAAPRRSSARIGREKSKFGPIMKMDGANGVFFRMGGGPRPTRLARRTQKKLAGGGL